MKSINPTIMHNAHNLKIYSNILNKVKSFRLMVNSKTLVK